MNLPSTFSKSGKIKLALAILLPVLILAGFFVADKKTEAQNSWIRMDTGHSSNVYLVGGTSQKFDWSGSGIPSNAAVQLDFVADDGQVYTLNPAVSSYVPVSYGELYSVIPDVGLGNAVEGKLRIRIYGRYNNTLYSEDSSDQKIVIIGGSSSKEQAPLYGPYKCEAFCFSTSIINPWEVGQAGLFRPVDVNFGGLYLYSFGQGFKSITGFPHPPVSHSYSQSGIYTVSSVRMNTQTAPPLPIGGCTPVGCFLGIMPGGTFLTSNIDGSIKTFYLGVSKVFDYLAPDEPQQPEQHVIGVSITVKTKTILGSDPIVMGGIYAEFQGQTKSCSVLSATLEELEKTTLCNLEFLTTGNTRGVVDLYFSNYGSNVLSQVSVYKSFSGIFCPSGTSCSINKNWDGPMTYPVGARLEFTVNHPLHTAVCPANKTVYVGDDIEFQTRLNGSKPAQVYEITLAFPKDSQIPQPMGPNEGNTILHTIYYGGFPGDPYNHYQGASWVGTTTKYFSPGQRTAIGRIVNIAPESNSYGDVSTCTTIVDVKELPNSSLSVLGKGKVSVSFSNTTDIVEEISQSPGAANIYTGYDSFQVASSSGEQKIVFKRNGVVIPESGSGLPFLFSFSGPRIKVDGANLLSNPKILNNSADYQANIEPSSGDWPLTGGGNIIIQGLRGNFPSSGQQVQVPKDSTAFVDFIYNSSSLLASQKLCESRSDSAPTNCNYDILGVVEPENIPKVFLTAQSAIGQTFAGWLGDCQSAGDNPTCSLDLNSDKNIQAKFSPSAKIRLEVTGPGKLILADINPFDGYSQLSGEECQSTIGQTKVCEFITYDDHEIKITPSAPPIGGYSIGYGPWTLNGQPYSDAQTCSYSGPSSVSSCDITVETPKTTVGKTFIAPPEIAGVTLTTQVIGQGTVTLAPAPVTGSASCAPNATCTSAYVGGTQVVLTATANDGETFIGWESTCNALNDATPSPANSPIKTCTVSSLDADKTIKAKFSGATGTEKTLSLKVVGPGMVTAKKFSSTGFPAVIDLPCDNRSATTDTAEKVCSRSDFPAGVPMVVTMTKAGTVEFVGYTGDCEESSGSVNSCKFTMDTNKSVCAGFSKNGTGEGCGEGDDPEEGDIDLKIKIDGIGFVSVAKSSAPNSPIHTCTNSDPSKIKTCSNLRQDEGTSLRLTASSLPEGGTFNSWSGGCSGTGNCTLVMNLPTPKNVTAKFNQPAGLSCGVAVSPSGILTAGQTATFNASVNNPSNHYDYYWSWRDISPQIGPLVNIANDDDSITVTNTYSQNGTYIRRFVVTETPRSGNQNPKTSSCNATVQVGPVVNPGDNLNVTCSVSPTTNIFAGVTNVTWQALVSNPDDPNNTKTYQYRWSGSDGLNNRNTSLVLLTYTSTGTKTGNVTVTDPLTNATAQCSAGALSINVSENPGDLQTLNMVVSGDGQVIMPNREVCRSQPDGGAQTCSDTFDLDESVSIEAQPDEGTNFIWNGDCSSANNPKLSTCNLVMNGNKNAGINFSAPGFSFEIIDGSNALQPDLITVRNPRPQANGDTEFQTDSVKFDISLNAGARLESLVFKLDSWDGLNEVACNGQTCFERFGAPSALFNGTPDQLSITSVDEPIVFRLQFPNRAVDEATNPNDLSPYRRDLPRTLIIRATATLLTDAGQQVVQSANIPVRFRFLDSRDTPPGQ